MSSPSLGEQIRERRSALGITQRELARRINVSHSTLSRLENTPGIYADTRTLVLISQELGLDLTSMMAHYQEIPDQEELSLIARARGKMSPEERDRMMALLRQEFRDYFEPDDEADGGRRGRV